jgi:ribosomal protein L18
VAYSHELKRYGLTVGLTNYAAAYATGLLLARRVDSKLKLGFKGMTAIDGKEYHVKVSKTDGAAPFKALLDVGLARTTTGARVFGALKGTHGVCRRVAFLSVLFRPHLLCACVCMCAYFSRYFAFCVG